MPSSSGDWDLTWNAENRLVAAESADTQLKFTYDYMGRRVRKQSYSGSDILGWTLQSDHRYVYDGWNLIAQLGTQNSELGTEKTFTWGLDLSQSLQGAGDVGGLLCVTTRNPELGTRNAYYATYDANGNISEYLDNNGAVVAHYEYSPFGKLTVADGAKAADFDHRFSTKFFDTETSLYYYGLRYYSPELGRWVNRDPIGERGGVNLHCFVWNSPLFWIDSLGLRGEWPGNHIHNRFTMGKFDGDVAEIYGIIDQNDVAELVRRTRNFEEHGRSISTQEYIERWDNAGREEYLCKALWEQAHPGESPEEVVTRLTEGVQATVDALGAGNTSQSPFEYYGPESSPGANIPSQPLPTMVTETGDVTGYMLIEAVPAALDFGLGVVHDAANISGRLAAPRVQRLWNAVMRGARQAAQDMQELQSQRTPDEYSY